LFFLGEYYYLRVGKAEPSVASGKPKPFYGLPPLCAAGGLRSREKFLWPLKNGTIEFNLALAD